MDADVDSDLLERSSSSLVDSNSSDTGSLSTDISTNSNSEIFFESKKKKKKKKKKKRKTRKKQHKDWGDAVHNINTHVLSPDPYASISEQTTCIIELQDRTIVTCSMNRMRRWSWDGKLITTFSDAFSTLYGIEWDEQTIYVISYDHRLVPWNIETGEAGEVLEPDGPGWITTFAKMNLKGEEAALVTGQGRMFCLWKKGSKKSFNVIEPSTILCVGRDRPVIMVSGQSCRIHLWDLNKYRIIMILSGHTDEVDCVTELKSGMIVSGSRDKTLKAWDAYAGTCLYTFAQPSSLVAIVEFSNEIVACGYESGTIEFLDIATNESLASYWINDTLHEMVKLRNSDSLAIASEDVFSSFTVDRLRVWARQKSLINMCCYALASFVTSREELNLLEDLLPETDLFDQCAAYFSLN